MLADYEPRPFGFASEELLTNFLRAEINAMTHLLARYPDLPDLFDAPAATIPQRTACFTLLAHRKLVNMIDETFLGRYVESPSLGDEELNVYRCTRNLVAPDAPAWVLEINEVVDSLPFRIRDALPEPLRRGGFDPNDSAQVEIIRSAAETLGSVEQIQTLTGKVFDQQLQRLERRWSASIVQTERPKEIVVQVRSRNKQKGQRKIDKQRMIRDKLIAEIADVAESTSEFLRLMDERKVKPQPTWDDWPGSWVQAYRKTRLRALIHKDKSRALSRIRARSRKR
jgi:hypothetical protein